MSYWPLLGTASTLVVAPLAFKFSGCHEARRALSRAHRSCSWLLGYVVSRPLSFSRPLAVSVQELRTCRLSSGCSTACFEAVDSRLPILGLFTYIYYSCNYIHMYVFMMYVYMCMYCWLLVSPGWVLYRPAAPVVSSAPVACFFEPAPGVLTYLVQPLRLLLRLM